mmetsp:Transcript_39636/g.72146  ORF Transcript_39636/g.72146 Transcript_39636/m.72146 type:complete len:216 (+) Transcript_39636:85-732(+)
MAPLAPVGRRRQGSFLLGAILVTALCHTTSDVEGKSKQRPATGQVFVPSSRSGLNSQAELARRSGQHMLEPVLNRRQLLHSTVAPLAGLLVPLTAQAKDMRYDSLCTYKCMDQCLDQLRVSSPSTDEYNQGYCQKTCNDYCKTSASEKTLDEKVSKGSVADKIVKSARKKKYDADKEQGEKIGQVDQALGRMFTLVNKTKFKSQNRYVGEAAKPR